MPRVIVRVKLLKPAVSSEHYLFACPAAIGLYSPLLVFSFSTPYSGRCPTADITFHADLRCLPVRIDSGSSTDKDYVDRLREAYYRFDSISGDHCYSCSWLEGLL
jgi:hypothetical protein